MKQFVALVTVVALTAEETAYLEEHNACMHGHGPMSWDESLTKQALSWAQHLADTGLFDHSPRNTRVGAGENLYMSSSGHAGVSYVVGGIRAWYDEIAFCTGPECNDGKGGEAVGHFTQLIWKGSTKLGCAHATGSAGTYMACQYSKAGNWVGNHGPHVNVAQSKTYADCGGISKKGEPAKYGNLSMFSAAIILFVIVAIVAAIGFGYWKYSADVKRFLAGKRPAETASTSKYKQPAIKTAKRGRVV